MYVERHVTLMYGIYSYDTYTINRFQYCSSIVCSFQYYSIPELQYLSIPGILPYNESTLNIQLFGFTYFGMSNLNDDFAAHRSRHCGPANKWPTNFDSLSVKLNHKINKCIVQY